MSESLQVIYIRVRQCTVKILDQYIKICRMSRSFLQIPSHDGHPCCSAIHFPLSRRVRDFHPLERAHGAQTKIRQPHIAESALLSLFNVDASGILLQKLFLSTWSSKIISLQIIHLHFFHFQKPFFFLDAFCAYPDVNTMYHGNDIFI